ncbi:GNAT family N-acetyltransferase [Pontibacter sp. MBLB2868]|uniref:GNAT family N-acetyltransferase n=1 Tax=Pontibacter sp. MBLB2868 TaxID=3451555 RepID=UPI003F757074
MTDRVIAKYISWLNNGKNCDRISTRQIASNVYLAKVWERKPMMNDDHHMLPYEFFFIQNQEGKYVAAILNMGSDLHWYVASKHRGKGYLSTALQEAVLPFIFQMKDEQRITINQNASGEKNYRSSRKVAEAAGFKAINHQATEFILHKDDFDWRSDKLHEHNSGVSEQRIKDLRKRVRYASALLLQVSNELEMKFGDDDGMKDVIEELDTYHMSKIEDLMWEHLRNSQL